MLEWIQMPSSWVRNEGSYPLKKLRWVGEDKSNKTAALMLYIIVLHDVNNRITTVKKEVGICNLRYSDFQNISGLSRTKISAGLKILINDLKLIKEIGEGRNNIYKVNNFLDVDWAELSEKEQLQKAWAKLPAKKLYTSGKLDMFHGFHLRKRSELNALKLYLLLVAQRDRAKNHASISYDTITKYTGIQRKDIRPARSILASENWITVQSAQSDVHDYSKTVYEIAHIKH